MLISSVSIRGAKFACIMFCCSFSWFQPIWNHNTMGVKFCFPFPVIVARFGNMCTSSLQARLCVQLWYLLWSPVWVVFKSCLSYSFFCLSIGIKHLSRLFSCAHWGIPFFDLDTKWSTSLVWFLIFLPFSFSCGSNSFLSCHFFPFFSL